MAMESQGSLDLDSRRTELKAVLQSKYFTRAPALARLLVLLMRKVF